MKSGRLRTCCLSLAPLLIRAVWTLIRIRVAWGMEAGNGHAFRGRMGRTRDPGAWGLEQLLRSSLGCPGGRRTHAGEQPSWLYSDNWPGLLIIVLSQAFILSSSSQSSPYPYPWSSYCSSGLTLSPPPSQRPMIELCIPSSLDPTLAPPGCHVVSLFTQYTPYTLAGGKVWDDQERNTYADKGKED